MSWLMLADFIFIVFLSFPGATAILYYHLPLGQTWLTRSLDLLVLLM